MAKGRDTGSWAYKYAHSKEHYSMMMDLAWDDFYAKVKASLQEERTGGEEVKRTGLQTQQSSVRI
jgi:hypothetical protein